VKTCDLDTWDGYFRSIVAGLLAQHFSTDGEFSATYDSSEMYAKMVYKAGRLADVMLAERKRREKEASKPLGGDRAEETI
jgi:hypothetical protein